MPKVVVLDESKSTKHPIMSVGGFVADYGDVSSIEEAWRSEKQALGLDPAEPVKYSMSWTDQLDRARLITAIGRLPITGVVALLEDFRPRSYRRRKETRSELYVHKRAFEYVLQRMVEPQYCKPGDGPHLVMFDHHDEFDMLAKRYAQLHPSGWKFNQRTLPSLADHGYCASLTAASLGPLIEVADLVVSCMTRWAGMRCAVERGKDVPERQEVDRDVAGIVDLFPTSGTSVPPRRQGYSVIVHREQRTGKELLHGKVDAWLNALPQRSHPDDIPF